MITPDDVRVLARRRVERDAGRWATAPEPDVQAEQAEFVETLLHPPTQSVALQLGTIAPEWARSWREPGFVATVEWQSRTWPSLGQQDVPVRCTLRGPDAIAEAGGLRERWKRLSRRVSGLLDLDAARDPLVRDALAAVVAKAAWQIEALPRSEFERLAAVIEWVDENPTSGFYPRQLPIRGIHSKWIEDNRKLVLPLVSAVTGRASMGLADKPSLVRMRILDPDLRPGGISDLAAPVEILAALAIVPTTVFVFENLENVLAMPDLRGAVAVHGSGYAVDRLRALPFVRHATQRFYWGDLDSHGFAILNQVRQAGVDVTSVLMDPATLDAHLDLAGVEPRPARGAFATLTDDEQSMLDRLRRDGDLRLEQERIEWAYALRALHDASGSSFAR